MEKVHHQIRLRILSCSRVSENHRGPEVPEVRVRVEECRDGLARITLVELTLDQVAECCENILNQESLTNNIVENRCLTSLEERKLFKRCCQETNISGNSSTILESGIFPHCLDKIVYAED